MYVLYCTAYDLINNASRAWTKSSTMYTRTIKFGNSMLIIEPPNILDTTVRDSNMVPSKCHRRFKTPSQTLPSDPRFVTQNNLSPVVMGLQYQPASLPAYHSATP